MYITLCLDLLAGISIDVYSNKRTAFTIRGVVCTVWKADRFLILSLRFIVSEYHINDTRLLLTSVFHTEFDFNKRKLWSWSPLESRKESHQRTFLVTFYKELIMFSKRCILTNDCLNWNTMTWLTNAFK